MVTLSSLDDVLDERNFKIRASEYNSKARSHRLGREKTFRALHRAAAIIDLAYFQLRQTDIRISEVKNHERCVWRYVVLQKIRGHVFVPVWKEKNGTCFLSDAHRLLWVRNRSIVASSRSVEKNVVYHTDAFSQVKAMAHPNITRDNKGKIRTRPGNGSCIINNLLKF
jgi:hypothetical protein